MLSRYHMVTMGGIFALAIIGNYALPMISVPIPWTIFLVIITAAMTSSIMAFAGAARYASPTLASESFRLSRLPEPTVFASDGKIVWAGVPVKGWRYLKVFINSGSNPGIAIFPASMLEQESEEYIVARCYLYHLSQRSIDVMMQKRSFRRLLTELGYTADKKMEVFFGMHSKTFHPDATHIKTRSDLDAYLEWINVDSRELKRNAAELTNDLKQQLELWKRIQGSDAADTAVRRGEADEQ